MDIGKHFGSSLDEANQKELDFREISWHHYQCSGSSQISSQESLNDTHQFLSLYKTIQNDSKTELIIYDIQNRKEERKILETELILDGRTNISQLPNGELFCYCSWRSGIALIIDRSYRVRMLSSGPSYSNSSALYFDNNIYCFGGREVYNFIDLSMKFDLVKNRWINLPSLPEGDNWCHSVV